jgi:hypothetical protein
MTGYGLLYAAGSVHDVVAHLAGTVTDVLGGRLDGVGSDPWTAAVGTRRDMPIAALVDEWAEGSPQFEDGVRAVGPPMAGVAVSDLFQQVSIDSTRATAHSTRSVRCTGQAMPSPTCR